MSLKHIHNIKNITKHSNHILRNMETKEVMTKSLFSKTLRFVIFAILGATKKLLFKIQ